MKIIATLSCLTALWLSAVAAMADESSFSPAARSADSRVERLAMMMEHNRIDDLAVFIEAIESPDPSLVRHAMQALCHFCDPDCISTGIKIEDARSLAGALKPALERRYDLNALHWKSKPDRLICAWLVLGLDALYFQHPLISPVAYENWQNGWVRALCIDLALDRPAHDKDDDDALASLVSSLHSAATIDECLPIVVSNLAGASRLQIEDTLAALERHYLFGLQKPMGPVMQKAVRSNETAIANRLHALGAGAGMPDKALDTLKRIVRDAGEAR